MNIGGNKSNKWKYILKPIWEEIQQEEELKPTKLFDNGISGNGLYLHKYGHCVKLEPVEGNGLYLTPYCEVLKALLKMSLF